MGDKVSEMNTPLDLDSHLCLGIYSANLAIQRTYKPLLDELGITYPQYLVLNLLWSRNQQTVGELAKKLQLEPSTLTPMLKRLELSSLVERIRNPENERQVIIGLTKQGLAIQNDAGCITAALLEKSSLDINTIEDMNRDVRILRDNLYRNQPKIRVSD